MLVREQDIGGATVKRAFQFGEARAFVGQRLTREDVLGIQTNNRQALIDNHYIEVYPPTDGGQRFVVSRGFAKFDVYEGRKVNDEPLTKAEAELLAGEANDDPVEP